MLNGASPARGLRGRRRGTQFHPGRRRALPGPIRVIGHHPHPGEGAACAVVRTEHPPRSTSLPAGAALLPEARRTLASARAATDAVAAVEGLQRGTLTLGVMQAGWLFDLPGLLARYRTTYPGIAIKLQQASTAELASLLGAGTVDVTFASAGDESGPDVVSVPLVRSPLVVAVSRTDVPFNRRRSVALAGLADREQVSFPVGWGVRTLADRALRAAGIEPNVGLEVNDTNTLLDLAEAGLGVAVIPEAIARVRPNLHQLTIRDGSWYWTIAAHTVAPTPVNPAARALWEMLKAASRAGGATIAGR